MAQDNKNIGEQITPDGVPIASGAVGQPTGEIEQISKSEGEGEGKPSVGEGKPAGEVKEVKTDTPAIKEGDKGKEGEGEGDEKPVDFTQFLDKTNILDEKPVPTEQKPLTRPDVQQQQQVESRDFSGLEETEIPLFRKMSNEAFSKIKPVYLDAKKLKTDLAAKDAEINKLREGRVELPENYYEHPLGYVLSPEFEGAVSNVGKASTILSHWEQQLQKFRSGSETIQNIHIDEKTGEFFVSKDIPIDERTESEILRCLSASQNQLTQQQNRLQALQASHTTKHKEAAGWISNFEKTSFPVFEKEKATYDPLVKNTVDSFPATVRRNPLATVLAKALITTMQLGRMLQQMQGNGQVVVDNKGKPKPSADDIKKGGPTDSSHATGAGRSESPVTFEDFENARLGIPR